MPVDSNGNRADVVMDPNATISRMNLGRLYEQYINAASRDLRFELQKTFGLTNLSPMPSPKALLNHPNFAAGWARLMRYYEIVVPGMHAAFVNNQYAKTHEEHMHYVLSKFIYLYYPPDNPPEGRKIIEQLEKEFKPTYGPVSYVGYSGNRSTTVDPVRIGSMYFLLLEKTADDWNAVSSGKLQNFGVLSQVTNNDRYSSSVRIQPTRVWGETEMRIGVAYVGDHVMAEVHDRNNSISSHKQVLQSVLRADKPSAITMATDRSTNQLGNGRPLQLVKHILLCSGVKFVYKPYVPNLSNGIIDQLEVAAPVVELPKPPAAFAGKREKRYPAAPSQQSKDWMLEEEDV